MKSSNSCARLVISGLVQGVFFRASARDVARQYGLRGWVRNRHDGKVEALAEGSADKIEAFVDWCRQGPPHSRVKDVSVDWIEPTGEFKDFSVRY